MFDGYNNKFHLPPIVFQGHNEGGGRDLLRNRVVTVKVPAEPDLYDGNGILFALMKIDVGRMCLATRWPISERALYPNLLRREI
jgi:hypothetical protein